MEATNRAYKISIGGVSVYPQGNAHHSRVRSDWDFHLTRFPALVDSDHDSHGRKSAEQLMRKAIGQCLAPAENGSSLGRRVTGARKGCE